MADTMTPRRQIARRLRRLGYQVKTKPEIDREKQEVTFRFERYLTEFSFPIPLADLERPDEAAQHLHHKFQVRLAQFAR